jgi:D-sedoheptulose 7-phosphate isomerase
MTALFLSNLAEHGELMARLPAMSPEVGGRRPDRLCGRWRQLLVWRFGRRLPASPRDDGRFIRQAARRALSTDSSALTCIGNDYSFDKTFAPPVARARPPG